MFSLVFLLKRFLSLARHHAAPVLCWPQTFNELSRSRRPLSSSPLPFRKRVQKYYLFPNWQALFSIIFHLFFYTADSQGYKNAVFFVFPGFYGAISSKKGCSRVSIRRFWQGREDGFRCFRPVFRDTLMGAPYYI